MRGNLYLHGILTAVLLMMFAAWNGGAILYPDTYSYLKRPARVLSKAVPIFRNDFDRNAGAIVQPAKVSPSAMVPQVAPASEPIMAGRSPYWGTAAFLFYSVAGFWGIVVGNALLLGTALAMAWSRGFGLAFGSAYYLTSVVLASLTTAGAFVAFMTPDTLTSVLIISAALMIGCWNRLTGSDRFAACAMACFAAISHDSHVALVFVLLGIGLLLRMLTRRTILDRSLAVASVPLFAGIAATMLLSLAAKEYTGRPPVRLPFLAAHLSDIPAAEAFLADVCPEAGYELCDHLSQFSRGTWVNFLFSAHERGGVFFASSQSVRDGLTDEQGRILLDLLKDRPADIIGSLALDGVRQIFLFDLAELSPIPHLPVLRSQFSKDILHALEETNLARRPDSFANFDRLQMVIVAASMVFLILTLSVAARKDVRARLMRPFVTITIAGVLANGFICGVAAAPLGRFQARVIFLVVFVSAGTFMATRNGFTLGPYRARRERGVRGQHHSGPEWTVG